jgi:hypothetical protein
VINIHQHQFIAFSLKFLSRAAIFVSYEVLHAFDQFQLQFIAETRAWTTKHAAYTSPKLMDGLHM